MYTKLTQWMCNNRIYLRLSIVTICCFIMLSTLATNAQAMGSPNYLPDGPHPRIFLTPTVISELQAKVAANDPDWLELKAQADKLSKYTVPAYDRYLTANNSINYAYEGLGWYDAASVLGLAYKITGNASYKYKLLELVSIMVDAGNASIIVDSGYPTRSVAAAMALLYDWLYADLDSITKANMIATINGWYTMFFNHIDGLYIPLNGNNNYLGGHILGLGLCGIATYGDNAAAPAINSLVQGWWDGPVVSMFTNEGAGGAILESYNYGPNHFVRLLNYAYAVKTATGKNIYSTYTNNLITNYFYNLKPNRWQSTDEGDMPGSFTGIMGLNLPLLLSAIDTTSQGDKAAFFYSNILPPYGGDSSAAAIQQAGPFDRTLFKNSRSKLDYRTTDKTYYRSVGDEHLYIRSDWTDNAVWSSFKGGAAKSTDHQSRAAGHLSIQRGNDYLLVNVGQWKGSDGVFGNPKTFSLTNNNMNAFVTDGATGIWGINYAGGQGSWGLPGSVLNYESGTGYSYMRANLTSAYDLNTGTNLPGRDLTYWHRNYVYLGSGTFILFDRVRMRNSTLLKEFRFHLHKLSTNTNSGGLVKSVLGTSSLHIKSIYPSTAVMTTAVADNASANPVIKLTDSATSTDFNPLTLLIADSRTATMPPTELVQSNDEKMIGVYIKSPLNPTVVLFSSNQNGADVAVSSGDIISYNLSGIISNSLKHLLVHLPPNADFTILPITSANGLVTFRLKTGAFPAEGKVSRASSQGVVRLDTASLSPPAAPSNPR